MKNFKYFGTDGVRGVVGDVFIADFIASVAKAMFAVCKPKLVVIGWDTRQSCDFIVNIFSGVLASYGAKVVKVGIVPTAALSFLANKLGGDIGVMISASHNDARHNGIKLFAPTGEKLDDETTYKIDRLISKKYSLQTASFDKVGKIAEKPKAIKLWQRYLIKQFNFKKRLRIAVDCAYGSGAECAGTVLDALGMNVTLYNTEFNGLNINEKCGATHTDFMKKKTGFDVGFAFDGDADRCVVFDENGTEIHGDVLIYLLSKHLNVKEIVSTIMFNLGVEKALNKNGVKLLRTPVGDRFIYKALNQRNLKLGGETNGHMIFPDIWRSGDGLLTALMVLDIMKGEKMSYLAADIKPFPQVSKSISVTAEQKRKIKSFIKIQDNFKIIVRPSGTENVVRITVEGQDFDECERHVDKLGLEIFENLC